jgi:hypothetical protein
MRRAALKIAQSQTVDRDDHTAMTGALSRLYGAATQSIGDIVGSLSASERARLAVFCYGRAHLNTIGLAIAATCDLDHLIVASSSATAGHALFTQSRDATLPVERASTGRRAPITLATAAHFATLTSFAADEPAELTA